MLTSYDTVMEYLSRKSNEAGEAKTRFVLSSRDTAWNPASTENVIYGPAEVIYQRFADGGITASVHKF